MADNSSKLSVLVRLYEQLKGQLEKELTTARPDVKESKNFCSVQKDLELAFKAMVSERPAEISEEIVKARCILNEVMLEAELTEYHRLSLHSIIKDLQHLLMLERIGSNS